MPELVFVYGSLKRGLQYHHLIEKAEFVGEAITDAPDFRMGNVGDFPEITRSSAHASGYILGEFYRCEEKTLKDLDRLEGNGEWYRREKIPIRVTRFHDEDCQIAGDECVNTWVYLWLKPNCPDIEPTGVENGHPVYNWSPVPDTKL